MKQVKYYVVPRADIEDVTQGNPLPSDYLATYEAEKRDVLNDSTQDIFARNSRSDDQRWKDMRLFRRTSDSDKADIVICQNWLELLYNCDRLKEMRLVIYHVLKMYRNQIAVFSWNHDRDSAFVRELNILDGERCILLDYNTSVIRDHSLLLPFWTVETNLDLVGVRDILAGFIGYVGSLNTRRNLETAIETKTEYFFSRDGIPKDEWLKMMFRFRFALCPRGGGLSSWRFYEAIQCGAVPVLFSDSAELPFPDLDYSRFSLRLPESTAGDFHKLDAQLKDADWDSLSKELTTVRQQFSLLGVQQAIYNRVKGMTKQ